MGTRNVKVFKKDGRRFVWVNMERVKQGVAEVVDGLRADSAEQQEAIAVEVLNNPANWLAEEDGEDWDEEHVMFEIDPETKRIIPPSDPV